LLKLRSLARPFITCTIKNGCTASFWFDHWTPLGPLIESIGPSGPRALRLYLSATVSEAVRESFWNLPAPRSEESVSLHAYLTTLNAPSRDAAPDFYSWTINGEKFQTFSSRKTWSIIRERQPIRGWHKEVWFKGHIPKHAFTMWIAVLDRLPTRNRLASWGMLTPISCCLCSSSDESRDHIFVECDYTKELWRQMLIKLSDTTRTFDSWLHLLAWCSLNTNKSQKTLRKTAVQAIIYNIWTERNKRIFNNQVLAPSDRFKLVDRTFRNIISARKTRKEFKHLMALWLV
ncbi:unnamed protein product, partial [Brassica rapa subsp. narinosa]